jgi:hypothetical protein
MSVSTQSLIRGKPSLRARTQLPRSNCGWFTLFTAAESARTPRGICHRYDYLSVEKTPRVRVDDWCFDHRPERSPGSSIQ